MLDPFTAGCSEIPNIWLMKVSGLCCRGLTDFTPDNSSPKFQEDQNELGIATAEDAQRSFGRNVRSKIR